MKPFRTLIRCCLALTPLLFAACSTPGNHAGTDAFTAAAHQTRASNLQHLNALQPHTFGGE